MQKLIKVEYKDIEKVINPLLEDGFKIITIQALQIINGYHSDIYNYLFVIDKPIYYKISDHTK